MTRIAYKLVDRDEWAEAVDVYGGSALDRADGYIHLSTSEQLAETAAKHYRGRAGLLLVAIDLAALRETLKWEASRGGALFPHIHGDLPRHAVLWEKALSVDSDGAMRFEDGANGWL